MSRSAIRFWASSLALTLVFAAAAAFLFPYESLRLTGPADRVRIWLLVLWTAGVMAILFGVAALVTFFTPLGFREVHDAGSVTAAREARKKERGQGQGFHDNFAWWLVCTGFVLILLYFVAWGTGVQL